MTKLKVASQAASLFQQLASSSPQGYVEIAAKLKAIQRYASHPYGLQGETKIGEVNHRYQVYLLHVNNPGVDPLVIYDPPPVDVMTVVDLPAISADPWRPTRQLVPDAAIAIGVTPTHVDISP